jgi:hypothetical protein
MFSLVFLELVVVALLVVAIVGTKTYIDVLIRHED